MGLDISGISELDLLATISPNPSLGIIFIQLTNPDVAQLLISNIEGKIIQQFDMTTSMAEVDLSRLAKGTYFVQVRQNGKLMVHKLLLN